ncbi:Rpn family recombination-promoting nuclease/putative transposase [Providencia stuartii]|uniref:Rpn family recombination-promoting nuclease/putative transposase n=1 Tax=Providencia stuartii TaxID=588 RepID=UPI00069DCE17|nr:Rpn family recombination-promoting nuclease/putative transposase [Providencia stuartii]EMD1716908.1 Rpn family recombination-promoting nuclease/putative transposase [Providencia stuartii]KNZ88136.1 transposase [Providencia stuartii]MBG5907596.1 Rpn family recombination-promoting nuclease/putative transposase [Providencia stuartii]WAZ74315.1 Rpn family recombination-promoting nuclease/putative transposase [Providencia stuartii]HAU5735449.1 Rpn family recombination-promoting nuclease/putative
MIQKAPTTPHDAAFKGFLTQIDNARDFFDIHLPEHIRSLCDFNTLALTNSSFIDKKLRSRLSDVLYTVQTEVGDGYLYLLIEHQSTPDKLMSWRLMHYSFLAMNQHLQQGHKSLPLVVPILFYHGDSSPYPYLKTWTHCFSWPELADELYFNPFPLVDITVIDDNELVNHRKIAVMELALKHKNLRDEYQQVTSLLAQALNRHYNSEQDTSIIINYLLTTLDSSQYFEQIIQQLIEQIENHQGVAMNIAQRLKDKAKLEGKIEGKIEGMQKARHENALSLLKNGASFELVMKSLNFSYEELQLIIQEDKGTYQ